MKATANHNATVNKNGSRRVRFGDVVRFVKEDADPDSGEFERYVAGEHIETDNLHIRKWGTIGDGYLGPAFHRLFKKGQVLYGSRRTYLRKIAVAEFDGITANTTFVLEPSGGDLLPELLPFIMQTEAFTQHSIKQSKGSVNPYINFKDIAWFEFALPPKDEQRRIAEILWAADANKSTAASVADELSRIKSAVFYNTLQKLPKKDSMPLGNLLLGSPGGGWSAIAASRDTGHYVLTLTALSTTGYLRQQVKPVNPTPPVLEARLRCGDFLISRSNTIEFVGLAAIFDEDRSDVSFPDTMMRLQVDERKIDKRFLQEFLLCACGRKQIQRIAAGTSASMKKINRQGLCKLLVDLPNAQGQRTILREVDSCAVTLRQAEHRAATSVELANALRRTLLEGHDHV